MPTKELDLNNGYAETLSLVRLIADRGTKGRSVVLPDSSKGEEYVVVGEPLSVVSPHLGEYGLIIPPRMIYTEGQVERLIRTGLLTPEEAKRGAAIKRLKQADDPFVGGFFSEVFP